MIKYQPQNNVLASRVILVSGAETDIGNAAAKIFARYGATVILCGGHVKELENTYDEIEKAGGAQPAIFPLDADKACFEHYEELTRVIESEFGQLHGLLHAKHYLGKPAPIDHYKPEEWARVLHNNLNMPFMLTQACLPMLRKAETASILFSTADVGQHGKAYWGAYGVSMAGQENLMQILADELESNTKIRVNSIDPGPIQSALRRSAFPGEDITQHPKPADIIMSYVYLMGDDSKEISGQHFKAQE